MISKARKLLTGGNNVIQLTIITIAIFLLMCILVPDSFLTMRNFRSMTFQFPELGILSLAMLLAMLTGGIDLSIVGIANLSSIIAAFFFLKVMPADAAPMAVWLYITLASLLAVAVGMLCGLLNGALISKIDIPPMLATLGTIQLFTGIAVVRTQGTAMIAFQKEDAVIGNGSIGECGVPLIIFLTLLIVFTIILTKTNFGINLYLIGSNKKAAIFAGIKVSKVLMINYMMCGGLAGLAGIVMSSRTNAAKADYGTSYILQSILVAVLGGVNPNGGSGYAFGILISALALQFLSSGFNMLRFSNFAKEFVWGVFLIAIMIVNYFTNEKNKT